MAPHSTLPLRQPPMLQVKPLPHAAWAAGRCLPSHHPPLAPVGWPRQAGWRPRRAGAVGAHLTHGRAVLPLGDAHHVLAAATTGALLVHGGAAAAPEGAAVLAHAVVADARPGGAVAAVGDAEVAGAAARSHVAA